VERKFSRDCFEKKSAKFSLIWSTRLGIRVMVRGSCHTLIREVWKHVTYCMEVVGLVLEVTYLVLEVMGIGSGIPEDKWCKQRRYMNR
jgi:hypothetical protein